MANAIPNVHMEKNGLHKMFPFPLFQAHCDERKFVYAGKPGRFDVYCRLGPERCNHEVCPIWNLDQSKETTRKRSDFENPRPHPEEVKSLRDINVTLRKNDSTRSPIINSFDQQCVAHGIHYRVEYGRK